MKRWYFPVTETDFVPTIAGRWHSTLAICGPGFNGIQNFLLVSLLVSHLFTPMKVSFFRYLSCRSSRPHILCPNCNHFTSSSWDIHSSFLIWANQFPSKLEEIIRYDTYDEGELDIAEILKVLQDRVDLDMSIFGDIKWTHWNGDQTIFNILVVQGFEVGYLECRFLFEFSLIEINFGDSSCMFFLSPWTALSRLSWLSWHWIEELKLLPDFDEAITSNRFSLATLSMVLLSIHLDFRF